MPVRKTATFTVCSFTDAAAYLEKPQRSDADGTKNPCRILILLPMRQVDLLPLAQ